MFLEGVGSAHYRGGAHLWERLETKETFVGRQTDVVSDLQADTIER